MLSRAEPRRVLFVTTTSPVKTVHATTRISKPDLFNQNRTTEWKSKEQNAHDDPSDADTGRCSSESTQANICCVMVAATAADGRSTQHTGTPLLPGGSDQHSVNGRVLCEP